MRWRLASVMKVHHDAGPLVVCSLERGEHLAGMSLTPLLLIFWRELDIWGPPCDVVCDCVCYRYHSVLTLPQIAREVPVKYGILPRIPPSTSMAHQLHVCCVHFPVRLRTLMSPHSQRIPMTEVSAAPSIASPPGGSRRSRRVLLRFAPLYLPPAVAAE